MGAGAVKGALLADARWRGPHGIGRFATEVLRRLPAHQELTGGPKPLSPLDSLWTAAQVFTRRPALYFSPGFNPPVCRVPLAFTIHDLMQIRTPEVATPAKRLYYAAVVRPACRRANRILTVSEYSRKQILEWTGVAEERIVNVGNGVGEPSPTQARATSQVTATPCMPAITGRTRTSTGCWTRFGISRIATCDWS